LAKIEIVVIGASAGGVGSLQRLVAHLPPDFAAAVLVTLHLPEGIRSMLAEILSRSGSLPATQATHNERIRPGHIYVAPAGFHMTIARGRLQVQRGAREHGHRPAIDPLFRSAAAAYGPRAIGVILSGALDDGTVGLREIKQAGGLAVVQDPTDTEWPSMPQSAIKHVAVDFVGPAAEVGAFLARAVESEHAPTPAAHADPSASREVRELTMQETEEEHPGEPSPYSCPDCGGVLWELKDGEMLRFCCRVGHAYTGETLTTEQAMVVEHALWSALRALEEQAAVRRRMADRAERDGRPNIAARNQEQARQLEKQAQEIRNLVLAGLGVTETPVTGP
jgi:two-component system chemotaxis response regulator CheB